MATSRSRRPTRPFLIQKPLGQLSPRVQAVGPEHFGVLCFDCAKERSKWMLADFYGTVLLPPRTVPHTHTDIQTALNLVRQTIDQHQFRDLVVAIEATGTYHRLVQQACKHAGWDTRLVHPFTSKQFRLPADPANKTDDTDLAGIFRATINGFSLVEPVIPMDYQQLQILIRHRRDLVQKMSLLCCQIRELLHALMPGYEQCFAELWRSPCALPLARLTGSAERVGTHGLPGLQLLLKQQAIRARPQTLQKILAWADNAPRNVQDDALRRQVLANLDDDRRAKIQQITELERQSAQYLTRTPYILLLVIPGINVVSAADLAGELGPISLYPNPNAITGRAGLLPSRYQSDRVDYPNGPLQRRANRRLRTALMQVADNLIVNNHYFRAKGALWKIQARDKRWMRVKVAKTFSRLLFAMVAGRQLFPHPCRQDKHYILHKLLEFHQACDTPMSQTLADLDAATLQLPSSAYAWEAQPLHDRLKEVQKRKGPQPLADILPIVLARLGTLAVQSASSEVQDLS